MHYLTCDADVINIFENIEDWIAGNRGLDRLNLFHYLLLACES